MPRVGLIPPPPGLTPKEYRDYLKAEIKRLGATDLLCVKDIVVFYSGPSKDVWVIVGNDPLSNHGRSLKMAKWLGASLIDDTQAATFLYVQKLKKYFRPALSPYYSDPIDLDNALNAAYAEVWGGVSELFVQMEFRHAATAVCGADRNRVFVQDELPGLVQNDHVETINSIKMEAVRRMFRDVSADEAFRLICLSELKTALDHAGADTQDPAEGWADFFERLSFYEIERNQTEATIAPLTVEQKRRKRMIIEEFCLTVLYAKAPSEWGEPVAPVSRNAPVNPALTL